MSAFWTASTSTDTLPIGRPGKPLLARLRDRREDSLHFAMDFPLDPARVVNLVRARHELLVHPSGYFAAIARRMHSALPEATWLGNLRLLHAGAQSDSECLLTWIYAKHFARHASESSDPTLGGRESLLSEISSGYLALPAVAAAERAVLEVGRDSGQRLLLPQAEAKILTDALGCGDSSNTPRWLAFSAAELESADGLWALDGMLKLRTLLDDAGEHQSPSEVGRASTELVRRIAATWLRERAPSALRVAREARTALFDAMMLHDARIRAEEHSPQRNDKALPDWLDIRSSHERLERQIGGVIDLALELSNPIRTSRESETHGGARTRRRTKADEKEKQKQHGEHRGENHPDVNQTALIDYLSGLLRGVPRHDGLVEALRSDAASLESSSTRDERREGPHVMKEGGNLGGRPTLFRLRAIGLIGAALRVRELRSQCARGSEARTAKRARSGAKHTRNSQPSNPHAEWAGLAPSSAALPLEDLLLLVKWLGSDAATASSSSTHDRWIETALEAQGGQAARPISRVGGFAFVPRGFRLPTTTDLGSAPRAFKPAEVSVARGARYLSGQFLPIIDASIAVVQLGAERAVTRVAALSCSEFETFLKYAPLSSSVIDRIRLALLRDHGAKAVELMPQFALPDLEPNAWLALWLRLHPGHPLPHQSEQTRILTGLTPAELDELPDAARKAYLVAYISRFGEDASHHIPSSDSESGSKTSARATGRAVTSLGSFLHNIASAARALPYPVVRRHVPLRALAAALPQEEFDQLDVSDLEVGELFGYGGPKARVVWTHAWRRLERTTPAEPAARPASADRVPSVASSARAAVLRAIERGRFTLRGLRNRAPESSGMGGSGEPRGDIARILLADGEIAQRLLLQVRDAQDVAFLARAGGKQVVRAFDDAMIAQLVMTACGDDDGGRLTQLLIEAASRAKAAHAAGTPLSPSELRGTIDGKAERLRCRSNCTALTAVQREMRTVAERVCASNDELMAATPRTDSERRTFPEQSPDGPPLPIPQPTRRRADVARALLRIIGLSSGRCEVPLTLVQKLATLAGGRDSADLMRAAIIGRRHERRGTAAHQKKINEAIAVALELSYHGLADEFPQLVDAALADSLDSRYLTHRIQKKRGGIREINEPDSDLKRLQRKILARMLTGVPLSRNAHGFIRGRSIRTNATAHTRHRVVLNVDIRNFFGSLPPEQVRAAIAQVRRGALTAAAVDLLVKVVTRAGALPQGAPTSPVITNIALRRVDGILNKASARVGIRYTRYADDLTFSGADGPVQRIVPLVRDVLRAVGLELHPDKTHVYRSGRRQLVTGLVVNDRPNLPRRDRRKLRAAAHAMSRGQSVHWNGEAMPPRSFAGRLAYLRTVSPQEADGLWKSAGLEKFFLMESKHRRRGESTTSGARAVQADPLQPTDSAESTVEAQPSERPAMKKATMKKARQKSPTETGESP